MESQYRCIFTLTHENPPLSSRPRCVPCYPSFSSDGKTLVTSREGGYNFKKRWDYWDYNVWDVNTGELKKTFFGLRNLTFTSDGKTLVGLGEDNETNVWDVNTGELKKTFSGLTNIALSLDGKTVAGSTDDNTIQLWDIETGELKNSLSGHSSKSDFIAFTPDGKTLVSRDQSTIKLWNTRTGELQNTIAQGLVSSVSRITFSPNGQTLAISTSVGRPESLGNKITLWDLETRQLIRTLDGDSGSILAFSHDEKNLFFSNDGKETSSVSYPVCRAHSYHVTRVWDLTTGKISRTFTNNAFGALSPDGQIFVGVEAHSYPSLQYKYVNILEVATGKEIKSFRGTGAVALSLDGKILAVGEERAVKLVDLYSGTSIATLTGSIDNFAFSPEGNILAVCESGGSIKLWQDSTIPIVTQQLHGDAYPHLKRLENLLAAELWEDAEGEMVDVIKRFPSQDLSIVDQLWVHYSKGHYGFSVQKQIWESILRNEVRRTIKNASPLDDLDQFEDCVGWGTVDCHPNFHGANDEFFTNAWERTTKGYYPREVYKGKELVKVFENLGEVESDR